MTDGSEPPLRPGPWQNAVVVEIRPETATAKTIRLRLSRPTPHLAGQHFVVRLTDPDGYQATRSYSVASAPDESSEIEITVERLPEGEVSVFLDEELMPGDNLEVRGPIGGWFVWRGETPAFLIGGGSGIVPLMAMLRLARRSDRSDLVRLVESVRTPADLYYSTELPGPETAVVYTRSAPPGADRPSGRLNGDDLAGATEGKFEFYVCGSSGFADHATELLVTKGIAPSKIRVERFGPTG